MPRLRQSTVQRLHETFSAVTLVWRPDDGAGSLADYAVKQGVFHLLAMDETDAAETRMLDVHYMAAFANAWPTVVEPLGAWRVVGTQVMLEGIATQAESMPQVYRTELSRVCRMIREASLHGTAHGIAAHASLATIGAASKDIAFTISSGREYGEALLMGGRLDDARDVLSHRLSLQKASEPDSMLAMAKTLNELAVLEFKSGNLPSAKLLMTEAISGLAGTPDVPPAELILMKMNLAYVVAHSGDPTGATTTLSELLEESESHLGRAHPTRLEVALNRMAIIRQYRTIKDLLQLADEASTLAEVAKSLLGEQHYIAMRTLNQKGLSQIDAEDWQGALDTFDTIYSLPTHLRQDPMLFLNRGVCQVELGQLDAATELYNEALRLSAHWPAHDHRVLQISQNLARLYATRAEHELAITTLRDALAAVTSGLGTLHPQVGDIAYSLGACLAKAARGENANTESLLSEATKVRLMAVEAYEAAHGREHESTLVARFQLGRTLCNRELYDEALKQFQFTLAGEIALHGEDQPELAMTHWNLAKCLRKLDRSTEAAKHRRHCWEIECKDDGSAAAGTLQTAHALAEDLIAADQSGDAMGVVASALVAAVEAKDEDDDRAEWVQKLRALQTGED